MAHGVVRTDLMFGTNVNAGLRSFKYMGSGSTATAIDNGNVVRLDSIVVDSDSKVNDREVWKAVTPAANTPLADIVLVATPELHYDERKHALNEFYNEAGKICRGYVLHSGDIFSVTADALAGITGSTAVGWVIELQAGTKLKAVSSATASTTTVGKLIQIEEIHGVKYYVVEVA